MSITYEYPNAKVLYVEDGDSINVEIDYGFRLKQTHQVRLAGINAPEKRAPGLEGENARDWLRDRLPIGCTVRLITEKPKDKYGRYLAWVLRPTESISINEQLIRAGYAVAYDGGPR